MAPASEALRAVALSWQANWRPALMVLVPLIATAAVWLPDIFSLFGIVPFVVLVIGLAFLLGHFAEERGRLLEAKVLRASGDWHGVLLLRHRDGTIEPETKARYHAFLSSRGFVIPTPQVEAAGHLQADRAYLEAIGWLQRRIEDPLVFPDVVAHREAYRYRLHLYALKSIGFGVAAACVAINAALMYRYFFVEGLEFWAAFGLALACFLVASGWRSAVRRRIVEHASQALALTVLAQCDVLAGSIAAQPSEAIDEDYYQTYGSMVDV